MKLSHLLILSLATVIFACSGSEQHAADQQSNSDNGEEELAERSTNRRRLLRRPFAIGDSLQKTDLRNFEFFGDFFKGRARYYHNHQDTIYHDIGIKGNNLLLCFFDDQIARLKYRIDRDISLDLMMKYGAFKFRPMDSLSRVMVQQGNVLSEGASKFGIHEDLKNYELVWQKPDKQIVYRSYHGLDSTSYTYEERIADYKDAMVYLTRF